MNLKKTTLGIMALLVSATLFAGCGGGGGGSSDPKGSGSSADKPSAAPIAKFELKGEPDSTFPVGNKTAKVYELKGLAEDEDFNFTGERIAQAGDAIYICGERIENKDKDGNGKEVQGLFKLPIKDMKLSNKEFITEAYVDSDHTRNLTVSGGNVLFEQKAGGGHKLGVYSGLGLGKEPDKWKDDYDEMVGSLEGDDILMVRSLDTICVGKRNLSEIKGVKEVAANVRETIKMKDAGPLRPVYIDANEMFLSCPTDSDGFTTALLRFDRQGKLLSQYEGIKDIPDGWAVTKHYILQAGEDGDMVIYNREDGKKVFDSKLRDMKPSYLAPMGDDMVLLCSNSFGELKFFIIDLK